MERRAIAGRPDEPRGLAGPLARAEDDLGRGRVLLITGLPGAGSSTLLRHLAGARRWGARMVEVEVVPGADVDGVCREALGALDPRAPAARGGALEALVGLLSKRRAAVFVDGTERLPDAGAALLAAATSRPLRGAIAIASTRAPHASGGAASSAMHLVLEGLEPTDAEAWIREVAPAAPPALLSEVCGALGGHVATLRAATHAIASGRVRLEGVLEDKGVLGAIEACVREATSDLPPHAVRWLRALAILRRPLPVGPDDEAGLGGILEMLLARHLIAFHEGAVAVVPPVPIGLRSRDEADGRLDAADLWARVAPRDPIGFIEAAHHLAAADDVAGAAAALLDGGPSARRCGWGAEVVRQARAIAPRLDGEPKARVERLIDASEALQGDDAPTPERVAGLAAAGRFEDAAEALAAGLRAHLRAGRREAAERLAAHAATVQAGLPDGSSSSALLARRLAGVAFREGRVEEARRTLERALDSLRGAATPLSVGIRQALARVMRRAGRPADEARALERALAEARAIGDRAAQGVCADALAAAHHARGRADLALAVLSRALAVTPGEAARLRLGLARCEAELGRFADAIAHAGEAAGALAAGGDRVGAARGESVLAGILVLAGRGPEGLERLARSEGALAEESAPEDRGRAALVRALAALDAGRLGDALERIAEARREGSAPTASLDAELTLLEAAALVRQGHAGGARAGARSVRERAGRGELRPHLGLVAARILDEADPPPPARLSRFARATLAAARAPATLALLLVPRMGLPPSKELLRVDALGERAVDVGDLVERRAAPGRGLVIDAPASKVWVGAKGPGWIDVGGKERIFDLLCHLARHAGQAFGAADLFREVWGGHGYDPRALRQVIRTSVHRLRALLEPEPRRPEWVRSHARPSAYSLAMPAGSVAIFGPDRIVRFDLDAPSRRLLEELSGGQALDAAALASRCDLPEAEVRPLLADLVRLGLAAPEDDAGRFRAREPT